MKQVERCIEMLRDITYYSSIENNVMSIVFKDIGVVSYVFTYNAHRKVMTIVSYFRNQAEIQKKWLGYCVVRFDANTKKIPSPIIGFIQWSMENYRYTEDRA